MAHRSFYSGCHFSYLRAQPVIICDDHAPSFAVSGRDRQATSQSAQHSVPHCVHFCPPRELTTKYIIVQNGVRLAPTHSGSNSPPGGLLSRSRIDAR
eukprot:scaffold109557_cov45-Tisochrysis_lutea.AAC.2